MSVIVVVHAPEMDPEKIIMVRMWPTAAQTSPNSQLAQVKAECEILCNSNCGIYKQNLWYSSHWQTTVNSDGIQGRRLFPDEGI